MCVRLIYLLGNAINHSRLIYLPVIINLFRNCKQSHLRYFVLGLYLYSVVSLMPAGKALQMNVDLKNS